MFYNNLESLREQQVVPNVTGLSEDIITTTPCTLKLKKRNPASQVR